MLQSRSGILGIGLRKEFPRCDFFAFSNRRVHLVALLWFIYN